MSGLLLRGKLDEYVGLPVNSIIAGDLQAPKKRKREATLHLVPPKSTAVVALQVCF